MWPNDGYVLLKAAENNAQTPGGLYVPTTATGTVRKFEVVRAGDPPDDSRDYYAGQMVLVDARRGSEFTHEGKQYLVVKHTDVLLQF